LCCVVLCCVVLRCVACVALVSTHVAPRLIGSDALAAAAAPFLLLAILERIQVVHRATTLRLRPRRRQVRTRHHRIVRVFYSEGLPHVCSADETPDQQARDMSVALRWTVVVVLVLFGRPPRTGSWGGRNNEYRAVEAVYVYAKRNFPILAERRWPRKRRWMLSSTSLENNRSMIVVGPALWQVNVGAGGHIGKAWRASKSFETRHGLPQHLGRSWRDRLFCLE
jgi:hypothetical protein